MSAPLLDVRDLRKFYPVGRGLFGGGRKHVHAVDGVSFQLEAGQTLALVGESGCGKSTVAKSVLRLTQITSGQILLAGQRIDALSMAQMRPLRRRIQLVMQDPFSSLNPRQRVRDILAEPLRNYALVSSAAELDRKVARLLDLVRLPADAAQRHPHEFSGGQRQRICIARALAVEPDLIVCDEAVSALDVSVKAQIVNLLQDLQQELGLALLFVSHDLAIVEHMASTVAVMYLGQIVELAPRQQIFSAPAHPYTKALWSSVPQPDPARRPDRILLRGDIPSPVDPPAGCRFHSRCPLAFERCRREMPLLREIGSGHLSACHLSEPRVAQNASA